MRIYELAKKINRNSSDIKVVLDTLGIPYKTHSSSIPEEQLQTVIDQLEKSKSPAKAEKKKSPKVAPEKTAAPPEVRQESKVEPIADASPGDAAETPALSPEGTGLPDDPLESQIEVYEDAFQDSTGTRRKVNKAHHGLKGGKESRDEEEALPETQEESIIPAVRTDEPIGVWEGMTVKDFSEITGIPSSEILKKLFLYGVMASINKSLDHDTLMVVAEEFHLNVTMKVEEAGDSLEADSVAVPVEDVLEPRAPVVTIMGHVNHGKTTLLDTLRQSRIAAGESGGITQHIGAYLVRHEDHPICFVDTPGHEAFTHMRAMGANVTDIVVLVVAANEGIQPQTVECISHAKEAEVPIIVAINKMDAEGANPDKVKSELADRGLTPEDWGGETLCVPISALKGDGLKELLDAVNLQSDMLELKANPKGTPFGIVLESCKTDHMGPLVTVLVKNGTFHIGDPITCGHVFGKIRRMEDDLGQIVKVATPSMPVRIFGFTDVPDTGARVKVFTSDREAKDSARTQAEARRHRNLHRKEIVTLDTLYTSIQAESKREFKIVLKADVLGSITALTHMFTGIPSAKVALRVLHASTGSVTESDVMLAHAYNAVILAFRTRTSGTVWSLARKQHVTIKEYEVIYQVYDDVTKGMEGLLEDEFVQSDIGTCQVKQLFKIGKVGMIAGCLVTQGKVTREAHCRIRRGSELLPFDGRIASLKHYKEEVGEVRMGSECGIGLDGFYEFQVGDTLEFFVLHQAAQAL